MKRVVSISLGSSERDKRVEVELLGEQFSIERIGTDGDLKRYARLLEDFDGQVDAIGLGGIDLYIYSGKRRYVLRDAARLVAQVQKTPIVDGSGLKNTLERRAVEWLQQTGTVDFRRKRTLMVCAVDRFGMAEALHAAGADILYGDLAFALKIPVVFRSRRGHRLLARTLLPLVCRLPFSMLYPTGEKQTQVRPKYRRAYRWAEVIAGDFHYIRRHMPEDLTGKVILTQTITEKDTEELRRRGVSLLVTTTPQFEGRSFATNVMEGVLVSLLGKRPEELTADDYVGMLEKLAWEPTVMRLVPDRDATET